MRVSACVRAYVYLGEVVWGHEGEAVDPDLVNAVDRLQHTTHPVETLQQNVQHLDTTSPSITCILLTDRSTAENLVVS